MAKDKVKNEDPVRVSGDRQLARTLGLSLLKTFPEMVPGDIEIYEFEIVVSVNTRRSHLDILLQQPTPGNWVGEFRYPYYSHCFTAQHSDPVKLVMGLVARYVIEVESEIDNLKTLIKEAL
jgi:hypothetical protein